jgi:hypothetical protein
MLMVLDLLDTQMGIKQNDAMAVVCAVSWSGGASVSTAARVSIAGLRLDVWASAMVSAAETIFDFVSVRRNSQSVSMKARREIMADRCLLSGQSMKVNAAGVYAAACDSAYRGGSLDDWRMV